MIGEGDITWGLKTNASWLYIDQNTGILSGTPPNDQPGEFWVNVSVDDGLGGQDFSYYTLMIIDFNDDPVITTTPIVSAIEDQPYSIKWLATDQDPVLKIFSWSLHTNAYWLKLDRDYLNGTPENSDVGNY